MAKRKTQKQSAKATLAEVIKEMEVVRVVEAIDDSIKRCAEEMRW